MASRATLLAAPLARACRPSLLRQIVAPRRAPSLLRAAHSIPRPPKQPLRVSPESEAQAQANNASEAPASEGARPEANPAYYQLSFTCVPCGHRSHHNVSKQGYHTGSVLITCPSCRNRHVISDHLDIFGERKVTVEDLMREKGRLVKRGSLGEDGDIEFWPEDAEAADKDA